MKDCTVEYLNFRTEVNAATDMVVDISATSAGHFGMQK